MTKLNLVRSNLDPDAVEIGELYEKASTSIINSARYLVECAHRLVAKKRDLSHGNWRSWLDAHREVLGFEVRAAQMIVKAASKYEVNFVFDQITATKLIRQIWGNGGGRGTQGTGEDEWFTPPRYIELVRAALGNINLDPASRDEAQKVVRAGKYFTKADNGLTKEWHDRVFLNPPYSQPLITLFINKMCDERQAGRISAGVALTHSYTDSAWFQRAAREANVICFPQGRVRFIDIGGDQANPTQGQAVFYFGNDVANFRSVFRICRCDASMPIIRFTRRW